MPNIIVKHYDHYNRTLGKWIGSRREYESEMAKQGFVSWEKGEQLVEKAKADNTKKYDGLTPENMKFLNEVKQTADRKGNIKVSDRFVKGLKDHGVKIDCQYDKLPKHYQEKGGFSGEEV